MVVRAQHLEKAKLDRFGEIFALLRKPVLLVVERDVAVEVRALRPVLVEIKHVRVVDADMKVVVYAALLGPRLADETREQFEQFGPLLGLGVERSS